MKKENEAAYLFAFSKIEDVMIWIVLFPQTIKK